jgi:hypothetical protein
MEQLADVDLPCKRILKDDENCDKKKVDKDLDKMESLSFDLVGYLINEEDDDCQSRESSCSSGGSREKKCSGEDFSSEDDFNEDVVSFDSVDENDNEEN